MLFKKKDYRIAETNNGFFHVERYKHRPFKKFWLPLSTHNTLEAAEAKVDALRLESWSRKVKKYHYPKNTKKWGGDDH